MAGRLPTARGVALTDEDRFRGEIIEQLMCELGVDLAAVAARHGRRAADLAGSVADLAGMEADGLIERHGDVIRITDLGRPFVRSACAAFDTYLDRSVVRHSRVV